MKLVTETPISIEEKRRMIIKTLWENGFRPPKILEICIREALFNEVQLSETNTEAGRTMLMTIVRDDFRDVQKQKIDDRHAVISELLGLTLNERQIAQQLVKQKLLPSKSWETAYALTRKDCLRVTRKMKIEQARRKPGATNLFALQMGRVFRDSLQGAQSALADGDRRGAAALIAQAIKASENIAIVSGVDINGKDRERQRGFDAATEAARAITDATKDLLGAEDRDHATEIEAERLRLASGE